MASFDEILIDNRFAFGAMGGPSFNTDVTILKNKREQRNENWSAERRKWDISYSLKDQTLITLLLTFFRNRHGRARGFRFQDPTDWKSCALTGTPSGTDQLCGGVADGSNPTFQLQKTFSDGVTTYVYTVYKPKSSSVIVTVGGVVQTLTTNYLIDYTTGIITFQSGHIPTAAAVVKAGFTYDVPVRFDIDELQVNLEDFGASTISQLPIIEIYPY